MGNETRRTPLMDELARMGLTPGDAAEPREAAEVGSSRREHGVERVADVPGPPAPTPQERRQDPPPEAPPRPAGGDRPWTQPTSESLTPDTVLRPQRKKPAKGWRRALYRASGGTVNLRPSPAELHRIELEGRARKPMKGCHRVAVISLKGGVGKTTTTAALGSIFGSLRGDRVMRSTPTPTAERFPKRSLVRPRQPCATC